MTTGGAIEFLESHQPMPNDNVATLHELEAWSAALEHALSLAPPDLRFVPLFLNSFPEFMEAGMYRNVRLLIGRHSADEVIRHLIVALGSSNPTIQMYAADFGAVHRDPRLVSPLIQVLNASPFGNAREMAASTLGAIGGREAVAALQDALHREQDPEVRETIEEVLAE